MPVVQINNIPVKFPFEPYDVQKKYMEKIIDSLQNRQHAILESPSGTGKTLSLLCATLAWLKQNNRANPDDPKPKVIYATRTHLQILQAMKEMKNTAYRSLNATVIASRDQLCYHPDLRGKSNTDKILMCKSMMREHAGDEIRSDCSYYQRYDKLKTRLDAAIPHVTDIEDLGSIVGVQHESCPYFFAKRKSAYSDIVFIPYGYLIDPKIRESYEIDLEQSIIIIDEAHNVNRVCEDSASTSIKNSEITAAIRDLNLFADGLHYDNIGRDERLKRSLGHLRERLQSMQTDTKRGGYLFQLLRSVNITQEDSSSTIERLEALITRILERPPHQEAEDTSHSNGSGLKALLRFLQTIYSSPEEKRDSSYRMHIEKKLIQNAAERSNSDKKPTHETILHFWCFDPAIRMKSLLDHDIRCLILTSSTLAPFDTFIAELGVQFPIRFISDHVIERNQKFAKILVRGFGGVLLDSNYSNRSTEDYLTSIGQSIREISQRVPGGSLVFFPSYAFMEKCMRFWGKENNERIWNEISQQTTICIETQDSEQFMIEIKKYYDTIREQNKATFLAVARGKMSEGLDFSDMYGRAVMMVGIPFAPAKDPKIVQKRLFLEAERIQRPGLPSGNDWYISDAIRTANQAMGRVIRHRQDYGAMLLCDKKFKIAKNKSLISKWIRIRLNNQIRNDSFDFNDIVDELSQFFAQQLPMPDPHINPESFILYEDDELFSTFRSIEEHSDEQSDDEATDDETDDDTINDSSESSDSSDPSDPPDSNEVPQEQPTIQMEEGENTQGRGSSPGSIDQNSSVNSLVSDDSDDESAVQPKRTKMSTRNTIESDVESNCSQNANSNPLIAFLRAALQGNKYQKLEEIVSKYNTDSIYESLRDGLFGIFDEPKLFYSLKGCVILFKHEHKTEFNKDCEQFVKFNKLKASIREFFKTQQ